MCQTEGLISESRLQANSFANVSHACRITLTFHSLRFKRRLCILFTSHRGDDERLGIDWIIQIGTNERTLYSLSSFFFLWLSAHRNMACHEQYACLFLVLYVFLCVIIFFEFFLLSYMFVLLSCLTRKLALGLTQLWASYWL